jgi:DNA polymerase III epsilon subunit-like protein
MLIILLLPLILIPRQKKIVTSIKVSTEKKEMRFLFFDTETNGLPTNYKAAPTQITSWPEIVSIAWEAWTYREGTWTHQETKSYKGYPPEGIVWNKESERIHGISYEQARSEGVPLNQLLDEFQVELSQATHVIAHNLTFDKSVVIASMIRNTGTAKWTSGKNVCTMMQTVDICKIPSAYASFKWPRLQELHQFLFKKEWEGPAHEALSDVQCMRTCYRELLVRGCLTVE